MNKTGLQSAFIALFAAIICAGCFMIIPLGVVPIVLQNALCILTAVLIGGIRGGAPTALFLIAGLVGLPVYAGGTSGIAKWMGPTGGFLLGYLLGAVIAGLIAGVPSIAEKKTDTKTVIRIAIAVIAGIVVIYIPGVMWFASWASSGGKVPADKTVWAYTMGVCVFPFLPGAILKIIVSIPIAVKLRPVLAQYLYSPRKKDQV